MQYYPNEVKAGTDVYNAYTEHENSNRRVTILCCDGMLQSGKTKGYKYR